MRLATRLSVLAIIVLVSCDRQPKQAAAPADTQGGSSASAPPSPASFDLGVPITVQKSANFSAENPLDAEAIKEAISIWKTYATPYGDGFLSKSESKDSPTSKASDSPRYAQLKGVTVVGLPNPLSAADKLNGVEWSGGFAFKEAAGRVFMPDTKQWTAWGSRAVGPWINLKKVKGKWEREIQTPLEAFDSPFLGGVAVAVDELPEEARRELAK